jgi:hypothetical protein
VLLGAIQSCNTRPTHPRQAHPRRQPGRFNTKPECVCCGARTCGMRVWPAARAVRRMAGSHRRPPPPTHTHTRPPPHTHTHLETRQCAASGCTDIGDMCPTWQRRRMPACQHSGTLDTVATSTVGCPHAHALMQHTVYVARTVAASAPGDAQKQTRVFTRPTAARACVMQGPQQIDAAESRLRRRPAACTLNQATRAHHHMWSGQHSTRTCSCARASNGSGPCVCVLCRAKRPRKRPSAFTPGQ